MARPFPVHPHGPRRTRRRVEKLLLACPRVCPEWELGALRVLMKPHDFTRAAIEHRSPHQAWPAEAPRVVAAARAEVSRRLGFSPAVHMPARGDYWMVAEADPDATDAARALAVVLSLRLPGLWFTLDRLFVRDGRFYRRERGVKLTLHEATNVHLPRDVRAALRDVLTSERSRENTPRSVPRRTA